MVNPLVVVCVVAMMSTVDCMNLSLILFNWKMDCGLVDGR